MKAFVVGDVVKLKDKGQPICSFMVTQVSDEMVFCFWIDKELRPQQYAIDVRLLERVE